MAFNEITGDALRSFDASRAPTAMPTIGTGPSTVTTTPKRKLQGVMDLPAPTNQYGGPLGVTIAGGMMSTDPAVRAEAQRQMDAANNPNPYVYQDANKRGAQANSQQQHAYSPVVYNFLDKPATEGQTATNVAVFGPNGGTVAPHLRLATAKDEHGNEYQHWIDDNAPKSIPESPGQHGAGSTDFNKSGPDYTASGGSTYQAPATPAPMPTVAAPDPNNPYTPGTDAYKARIASMTQGVDDAFLGAEQGLTDSMASQGHISSGAEALLSSQHARAQEDARNDMLANDPLRSLDYVNKGLGNTMTSDQVARYGAETPMYLQGLSLANQGKTLSNQGASLDIQKTSALLPYEISAAQTGDAKAKADLDAFVQQMPAHLQQLQSQGALTKAQADQATWLQQNQGWLAALSFISNVIGGGGKIAGEALGLGLAPNSAYGAG